MMKKSPIIDQLEIVLNYFAVKAGALKIVSGVNAYLSSMMVN